MGPRKASRSTSTTNTVRHSRAIVRQMGLHQCRYQCDPQSSITRTAAPAPATLQHAPWAVPPPTAPPLPHSCPTQSPSSTVSHPRPSTPLLLQMQPSLSQLQSPLLPLSPPRLPPPHHPTQLFPLLLGLSRIRVCFCLPTPTLPLVLPTTTSSTTICRSSINLCHTKLIAAP